MVGVLSYAIYLVHTTVIRLVEQVTASRLALALLSAVATLLVAYVLHRAVEVPFIEWRKRLAETADEGAGVVDGLRA
jgi:peptidoglycan/LPS O-acetylase OafA/YrhL